MIVFLLVVLAMIFGVLFTKGSQRKIIIGVLAAVLYFPIGVIMALAKSYM